MKTLSANLRPYNRWKAETLSFLHVLFVLGVKTTSLLNKTRQSYGIRFKGAFFRKIKNSPIKRYRIRFDGATEQYRRNQENRRKQQILAIFY